MTIDELNSRFGAPGRIVFHPGHCGYPEVVIANKFGTAEVALLGANVLSYRPTGHSEVLFRPAKRDYNRGESFHGGIPVCWPQFGNRFSKELPQHGFARLMPFEVRGTEYSEEMTEVKLGLRSTPDTKSVWPHEFDLELKVSVSMKLNLRLTTRNTGTEPFDFSCGFHPYLRLRDRQSATVKGLSGCDYFNGVTGVADEHLEGDLKLVEMVDHIFTLPAAFKHEAAVLDPSLRRALAVASSGNTRAVVWNPGDGNESKLADFAAGDAAKFVCVEPVSDWPGGRTLAPGESQVLTAAIQSTMEKSA